MSLRTPTTAKAMLDWHHRAMAGDRPVVTNEPHVGYYKRRLIRGGPWVPAVIWLHQVVEDGELLEPEAFRCMVGHKEEDAEDQWTYLCAHPISESEYRFMMADREWAFTYSPGDPVAQPQRTVDFNKLPPPF